MSERKARSESVNQVLRRVNHKAGGLYDFLMITSGILNGIEMTSHGQSLTILEMRIIMLVNENPGITATDLCKRWNRSRGAISQMLKKIEEKGFVYREKGGHGGRLSGIYATDWGVEATNEFTVRDFQDNTHIMKHIMEECSEDELRAFYKVMDCYCRVLKDHPETHWKNF